MRITDLTMRALSGLAGATTSGWRGFAAGGALGLVLMFIVACASSGTGQTAADRELGQLYNLEKFESSPKVRVRVSRGASEASISGPAKVRIENGDGPSGIGPEVTTPVTITMGAQGWEVRDSRGEVTLTAAMESAISLAVRRAGNRLLSLDGTPLAGDLVLQRSTSEGGGDGIKAGGFDVVEHVSIDLYVPGVLASELPAGWNLETYKAQAIAARSYALHERQRQMADGLYYDLESTTKDQAYAGATTRSVAHKAVEETLGQVLTWKGTLLRAYYSSTTAGRAASARDIWPTRKGYEFNLASPIQASARDDSDAFSPLYRWEVKRSAASLSARLKAYGEKNQFKIREMGTLKAIAVTKSNEFGRPTEYTFKDAGGKTWTLSAEHARMACNCDAPGQPAITKADRVNSGDFEAALSGDTFVIKGRGFGHGVGMSQYGAEGMARKGADAKTILAYYYPGAEITQMYEEKK